MKVSRGWFIAAICVLVYGVLTLAYAVIRLVRSATVEDTFTGVLFVIIGGLAIVYGVVVLRAQVVARRQRPADDRVGP